MIGSTDAVAVANETTSAVLLDEPLRTEIVKDSAAPVPNDKLTSASLASS